MVRRRASSTADPLNPHNQEASVTAVRALFVHPQRQACPSVIPKHPQTPLPFTAQIPIPHPNPPQPHPLLPSFTPPGIPLLESLATSFHADAQRLKVHENSGIFPKLLSGDDLLELATRNATQDVFLEALANEVDDVQDPSLLELKKVMFGLLYLPGMGVRAR